MLTVSDASRPLRPHPTCPGTRAYQVRIGVVVNVEVSATGDDDAYDLAEDAIDEALRQAPGIEFSRDGGERIEAIAGEFDDDGINS